MTKRLTLLLVLVVFTASLVFAQTRNVQNKEMKIPDPNFNVTQIDPSFVPNAPADAGDEFLVTGYDYFTNNATRDMIDLVDLDADGFLDPIMAAMERFPDASGDRFIYFGYKAFGIVDKFLAFDGSQVGIGWPDLQVCVGGPFDGNALVFAHYTGTSWHSQIDLAGFQPVTPFPQTTFGGNFPSFAYTPDAIIASNTDLHFYASDDAGATFTDLFQIGDGDPNVDISAATNTPAEIPVQKSADNMTITSLGVFESAALTGNPHPVYLYGSTDGGATWSGNIIGSGNGTDPLYGQITNRTTYAPYFENFSQVSLNVDDMGYAHVTANGYGEGVMTGSTDTTNLYGMLYWNSNHQNWIAVTDEGMEAPDDGNGNAITDLYPGNGIGNAYGTTSVTWEGNVVVVAWQGPEYTGAIGGSAYNVYPGDGGASTAPKYWTDIYYKISEDGGATWSTIGQLQGDPDVMEVYPILAPRLELLSPNMVRLHYMYMVDAIPGTSLFASENSWSNECKWYYNSMDITLTTDVEDEIVVNSFDLSQNYPNPFNPTTNIKYTLAERTAVSLTVFDVLGNEVATLVNTTQDAGAYDVNFDASDLSSGLYIYTLNAGNFTSTKKMMLLK